MNYRSAQYIEQYNKKLREQCDWEVDLRTLDGGADNEYGVYDMNPDHTAQDKPMLVGFVPITTPVEVLISCASICQFYYSIGKLRSMIGHIHSLPDSANGDPPIFILT